ncbi:MAG: undecaprenyl-diphosphate phosphatase [Bdellovibrionaceae bacterium]|nr:undecaprenyl-diphosphate phosphatase [Pseudobdellovibrionaceae bacterium]
MTIFQVIILSIIEGLTEFLPISSTGHMIIASHFMTVENNDFLKSFEVIIQFGAILSVVVLYRNKFLNMDIHFYKKLLLAFLPTAMIGFLFKNKIDQLLDSVVVVSWSLIIGGIILILSDYFFKIERQKENIEKLTWLQSIALGFFQSIALIPGVSRSGSTILGGLIFKLQKKEAAEFSFFLAVPTMAAATLYKSIKILPHIKSEEITLILIGSVISFIVAYIAIKSFISIVSKYGFTGFGIYRIILGICILFYS